MNTKYNEIEIAPRKADKALEERLKRFYYYLPLRRTLTADDSFTDEQWVEIEVIPDLTDFGWYLEFNGATWRPTGFSTGKKGLDTYKDDIQKAFDAIDWEAVFTADEEYNIK